jgi:hypothetical protein
MREPTKVVKQRLAPERRQTGGPSPLPRATPAVRPSRAIAPLDRQVVTREAVIQEQVSKVVIEDIQPVVYREVVQPTIVQIEKPIIETIWEAPVVQQAGRRYQYSGRALNEPGYQQQGGQEAFVTRRPQYLQGGDYQPRMFQGRSVRDLRQQRQQQNEWGSSAQEQSSYW